MPRMVQMLCVVGTAIPMVSASSALAGPVPPIPMQRELQEGPFAPHVREAALRFGIPEAWLIAVMRTESAGDPRARSSAGAIGLMQVMPATWRELTARHRLGDDPWDRRANVLAGAAYLRHMIERYGDLETALAAYNAGPARADAWRRGARALPAETVHYVEKVLRLLGRDTVVTPTFAPAGAARPDWRDSPLFTGGAGPGPAALPSTTNAGSPSIASAEMVGLSPTTTAALPAERLFVALSPAGQ